MLAPTMRFDPFPSLWYLVFGRHLEEIHVTWAHLEKKRTRLRTNTKTLEDLCSQRLGTASPTLHDAVTTHLVTVSQHFMTASARTDSHADLEYSTHDGIIMVNVIPPDHVDDVAVVEPNQHDDVAVVPKPVLEDKDEDLEEEEFKEEEEPQEEEDDTEVDIEEDENEPELTYPYKEVDPLNTPPPVSESKPEDVIEVENPIEHGDKTIPASIHKVGESSTAPLLREDSDGLLPGLMKRDINSLFGRMTSLSRRLCVLSSVEQGTAVMENMVEKLGNAKDKVECKKLKKELDVLFGNGVYGSDSEGIGVNPSSNEFRLCNSDEWRSGNHGGRVIIRGYGGCGDMVVRHGLKGCLDHWILRSSPILPPFPIDLESVFVHSCLRRLATFSRCRLCDLDLEPSSFDFEFLRSFILHHLLDLNHLDLTFLIIFFGSTLLMLTDGLLELEYEYVVMNPTSLVAITIGSPFYCINIVPVIMYIQRISLTGFPAQCVGSSNTDVLESPCLLVLITGTSQSRQHIITSSIHIESCKSPTADLFNVDSGRISIVTVNT
ncbi:hypothetical protein Tco_1401517 [Tanacetum coccineum]